MQQYLKVGSIPKKRHTELRREGGYRNEGIYYEEVVSTAGFDRAYAIAYHLRPPTRVKKVEPAGSISLIEASAQPLRHHHFKTKEMRRHGDAISGRVPLLFNEDVVLSRCRP